MKARRSKRVWIMRLRLDFAIDDEGNSASVVPHLLLLLVQLWILLALSSEKEAISFLFLGWN